MSSLRQRTLWRVMLLLLLGTGLLALYNYHDSSHEINEVYDAHLAQNARLLQGVMSMPVQEGSREALYQAFNDALGKAGRHQVGHPYESKLAFQVWGEGMALLVHTPSAPPIDPPPTAPGFYDFSSGGEQWRGFVLPVPEKHWLIWVGERDDVRYDLIDRIVRHTLFPFLLGSLALALLVWAAIGWGLRPLQNMANVIRRRHADSLEPLQLVPLPTELEPMQAALNRMLAQIQQVLGRERRFIADAAHEMRTPLAVLRVHAQNLQEAGTEAQRLESLAFLIAGVDRTSRLVNQLLTMARLEPKPNPPPLQRIDLSETVRNSLVQLTPWLLSKQLELAFEDSAEALHVMASTAAIDIALNNLITNAANFSPEHGVITVTLTQADGLCHLSVEDQGPGSDEEDRERLFERFYSRGNAQGAGLGLTIVNTIATQLGGRITLVNRAEGGLRATLSIPSQF